jgi:hypothetical protein
MQTIEKTLRGRLLNGEIITVSSGNYIAHTTETRKAISILRAKGYPISDAWRKSDKKHWKEYFITPENRIKLLEGAI